MAHFELIVTFCGVTCLHMRFGGLYFEGLLFRMLRYLIMIFRSYDCFRANDANIRDSSGGSVLATYYTRDVLPQKTNQTKVIRHMFNISSSFCVLFLRCMF